MVDVSHLPYLGVGAVYVSGLEPLFEPLHPLLQVMEIEPQTLRIPSISACRPDVLHPTAMAWLQNIEVHKILHGVGNPVGGSVPPDEQSAKALARTAGDLAAAWTSEHLNFMHVADSESRIYNTGMMMPTLQTIGGAKVAASNIKRLKGALKVPFAVETPVNYLRPQPRELADGSFFAHVVERADCGILLDLHNLWCNERNGRQSVSDFLASIPLNRVWEIHFAGGFEYKGYWLDAHSGPVPAALIELAENLVPRLHNLRAIIYEILPAHVLLFGIDRIQKELEILHSLWDRRPSRASPSSAQGPEFECVGPSETEFHEAASWERRLASLTRFQGPSASGPYDSDSLAADPGIGLLKDLIWQFRAGAIVDVLPRTSRLLSKKEYSALFRGLLSRHFASTATSLQGFDEGIRFAESLRAQCGPFHGLETALSDDLSELYKLVDRYSESELAK